MPHVLKGTRTYQSDLVMGSGVVNSLYLKTKPTTLSKNHAVTLQHCYLYGPVNEHVGLDLPSAQDAVERPAARVLHHQAQVGLLKTHPEKTDDVLMEEEKGGGMSKNKWTSLP